MGVPTPPPTDRLPPTIFVGFEGEDIISPPAEKGPHRSNIHDI